MKKTHSPINLSVWIILIVLLFNSCKKDAPIVPFFSINDDKKLGKQVADEIAADATQYPIADSTQYSEAYQYLYAIRNQILNSEALVYKNEFVWKLYIIKDDNVLNAFCTPGGYIYVYTGLMKFLNSKDQLAGVLGHEMAHADRRHTSRSLQAQYGVSILLDILLGKNSQTLKQIAGGIYSLQNSKDHEKEADKYSVKYLCATPYNAAGAAGFFQKLIDQGNECQGAFFSTHPCPENRVQAINEQKTSDGCNGDQTYSSEYEQFKTILP